MNIKDSGHFYFTENRVKKMKEMKQENQKPVTFVGAGPGDPDLITIKGRRALLEADLVIYAGSLVPEALLIHVKTEARKVNSASMHLDEIISEMEKAYWNNEFVVRLHTGDPSLYGAIFEQITELDKRSIPFKIIPGVTAAFGAVASMGIEYTLPEVSQTLILTRMEGRTPVPEKEELASLASHQASMAIYLSMSLIHDVAGILGKAYGKKSICAVVYRATQPEEKIIYTEIEKLEQRVKQEKIKNQALIIAGKVLNISQKELKHKSKLYDEHFSHGHRQ